MLSSLWIYRFFFTPKTTVNKQFLTLLVEQPFVFYFHCAVLAIYLWLFFFYYIPLHQQRIYRFSKYRVGLQSRRERVQKAYSFFRYIPCSPQRQAVFAFWQTVYLSFYYRPLQSIIADVLCVICRCINDCIALHTFLLRLFSVQRQLHGAIYKDKRVYTKISTRWVVFYSSFHFSLT